jgi:DNA polymerase III alpha subunit (gram-positive type)
MSKKINSYVVLDFETGGLSPVKNPICEVACLGINGVTLEEVLRYDNVVKPYDKTLLYEEEVIMKIHGLTHDVCEKDGENLRQVVEDLTLVFQETNVYQSKICKPILVGHNITFDIPFLTNIFKRANIPLKEYVSGYEDNGVFIPHHIDTMFLTKGADGHKDEKTVKFSLIESVRRHSGDIADAHRALNDVIATASLFRHFMSKLRSQGSSLQAASDGSGLVRKKFKI